MKQNLWIFFFLIVLLTNMVSLGLSNEILEAISKSMLMPVLIVLFAIQTAKKDSLKIWIVSALVFSWIGDLLLLFQGKQSIFFLLGLTSFLLAHIFYIIFFHSIRVKENLKTNLWLLVIVVVYYAVLITILSPHLGDMKLPVRIYGIVISFMFFLAMQMLSIPNKIAGRWMMLGALLFVISDSILAIDKFYSSFDFAGILIMLTYGGAQLFLVQGAVKYLNPSNSN